MTKAAKFTDQVPEQVKSERLTRLLARHREIAFALAKKYEGQTLRVLVERFDDSGMCLQGRSTQNKSVFFSGDASLIGSTVDVRIREAFPIILRGDVVQ